MKTMKLFKLRQGLIGCLMAMCLQGCAPSIQETNLCDHDGIILVSRQDILTPGTARQILSHNMEYSAICHR